MEKRFSIRKIIGMFASALLLSGVGFIAIEAPAYALAGDTSVVDNALVLNGTSQGASRLDSDGKQDITGNMTMEAWIKPSASTPSGLIIGKEFSYSLEISAGFYQVAFAPNWSWRSTGIAATQNRWQHIAFTKSGNVGTFYLDGKPVWTKTDSTWFPTTVTDTNQQLNVGSWYGTSAWFAGQIDEVRIWNSARTAAEILAGINTNALASTTGLLSYYTFNEVDGTATASDYSGNGTTLTLGNSPSRMDVKSTSSAGGKTIITFPRTYLPGVNGWTAPTGITKVEVFAVGGGGGAGGGGYGSSPYVGAGGGGGAGGQTATNSALAVTPGTAYSIQVGQGGQGGTNGYSGGPWAGHPGASGGDSRFGSSVTAQRGFGGWGGLLSDGTVITTGTALSAEYAAETAGYTATARYIDQNGGQGGQSGSYRGQQGFQSSVAHGTPGAGGGGSGAGGQGTAATGASSAGTGGPGISYLGTTYGAGAAGGLANNGTTVTTLAAVNSGNGGIGGNGSQASGTTAGTTGTPGAAGAAGIVIVSYATVADYAFNFSTSGDNKYTATGKQVVPSKASYTFETWINANTLSTTSWNDIFRQEVTNNYSAFGVGVYKGDLQVVHGVEASSDGSGTFNSQDSNNSLAKIVAGQWYHIAVSTNFTSASPNGTYVMNIYVNGSLVWTKTIIKTLASLTTLGNAQLSIGGLYVSAVRGWDGQIDQIKVWNGALTQAEIQKSMHTYSDSGVVSTSGSTLRAFYDFNQTSAATLKDLGGSGYDFAPIGAQATLTDVAIRSTSGSKTIYKFPRSYLTAWGGWSPTSDESAVSYLVAGGGGGAGKGYLAGQDPAGSGGGGGVTVQTGQSVSAATVYPVKVGLGGLGAATQADDATSRNGQSSTFSSTTALGGGGGGSRGYAGAGSGAGDTTIATGGGGAIYASGTSSTTFNTGSGVVQSGNNAGRGLWGWGGAGGGAGGAGVDAISSDNTSKGGAGVTSALSGTSVVYGAGGFAGAYASSLSVAANSATGGFTRYGASAPYAGAGAAGAAGVVIVSILGPSTVTYNYNGATGSATPTSVTVNGGASTTLPTPTKSGSRFAGWYKEVGLTTSAGAAGVSYSPDSDITLYAKWTTVTPVLYYNFSDRDSTHGGTTAVTNLGSNSAYTATKIGSLTHDYTTGKLAFTGGTNAAGPYVDISDINTAQFNSGGITIDFEADFGGVANDWERLIDFGTQAAGTIGNNILVTRQGTTNNLLVELWSGIGVGAVSKGTCLVSNGLLSAGFVRWTITLDGSSCKIYKAGVTQTVTPNAAATTSLSAGTFKPENNVNWTSNFLGRSNWTSDAQLEGSVRSLRIYAGAYTPDEAGEIAYRTVNFNGNYTGAGAISSRYTSGKTTLQDAPVQSGSTFGGWYDNVVSSSGVLLGQSGDVYVPSSASITLYAGWASSATPVDVQWNELNYDYTSGHYANKVGTGFAVGDKVLFKNVITKDNICVDSLVTTKTLSGATVKFYESGTGAGGAKTNFEVDMDLANANSYGEYQFDYYVCDTYGTGSEQRVQLKNLALTLIDIDYLQWNEVTGIDSFTLSTTTNVKYGPAGTTLATGSTVSTTNGTLSGYPANVRFQGPSAYHATITDDQAVMNYASITTFNIKLGRSQAGNPNYYGIAFKALPWGSTAPATNGPVTTYTIAYNGNGNGGGTVPASQTGAVGTNFSAQTNSGTLTKAGYTFSGWNTAANGSGTAYPVGSALMVPNGGMTLYAVWVASQFTLTYNANGGTGAPAVENRLSGATANLSATVPTRAGYVFAGWNTVAAGGGTSYASSVSYTMGSANATLYAQWTAATGSIAYDGNSSTGGTVPTTQTGSSGGSTTVSALGSLVRQYYTFSGWNTAANGSGTDYSAGGAITYPGNAVTTTLYAQWTPILYTLTYNANGGTLTPAVAAANYAYNASVSITGTAPTRTGYTFAGWTVASNGTGTVYGTGTNTMSMPGANTVLYAKWTAITYTLTYDVNGGSSGPAASTNNTYGASITLAAAPTPPANMKFNGWNTDSGGAGSTYSVGGTYQITSDVTLYAQWVPDNVNLFFSANGGTGAPTSSQVSANTNTTLPSGAPIRTGYTFAGWTTNQNGSGTVYTPSGSFPVPNSDVTLYAKWTPISYNFIYDANGGSGAPATVGYYMGQFVVIGGTATRSGYNFEGWNTLADGTGADYLAGSQYLMSNSNMTMYAKWTAIPYVLTYNANGGTGVPASETRYVGASANLSATTPTHTGYTFGSWNTAANGSGTSFNPSASFTMPAAAVVLYAQWVVNGNTVSYNVNGGSSTAPTGGTYAYNSNVTVNSTVPTWAGHRFLGWNTQQNGGGTTYASSNTFTMPNNAVVLWAQWGLTSNIFSYDANGGSGAKPAATYSYGATVTVTTDQVIRGGYTFVGWNSMADGTGTNFGSGTTFTMPANDVVVYAIWSANAYTLFYNMNGGIGAIPGQPGSYQSLMTVSSTAPTRTGFTFSGWNTDPTGSGGTDYTGGGTFNMPSSNVTLYAKWTAISYTLTYNANGGSGSPSDATGLNYGSTLVLSSTIPIKTGFVFTGWTANANGTGASYAQSGNFLVPASNTTLYAQWVDEHYELIYNPNGGSGAPDPQDVTAGLQNLSNTAPVRPGYIFGGWNLQQNGGGATTYAAGGQFNVPTGNTVLYAVWTLADVTLQFDLNGSTDTAPSNIVDKYLATITLPGSSTFARSTYTFVAWNTAADGSGQSYAAESNFVMPATNQTLYAQWSAVYYAVEYNANGGSGKPNDQYANPGQTVAIPTQEPTKSGYDFDGWTSANPGNQVPAGGSITMPSNNVLLVATWRVKIASVGGGSAVQTPVESPTATPTPTVKPTPTPTPTVAPTTAPQKLAATVYFKGDSAVLQPAAKKVLQALAVKAKRLGKATKIQVFGRVKQTPDKSYDIRLSRQRATNVANYLKKLGVRGVYIITAAGISPENRPISRRADMYLYWSK